MNTSKIIASVGIVLKNKSIYSNKSIVLDQILGRIECWTKRSLSSGLYISYNLKKSRYVYFLEDIDIIDSPDYWIKNDILFFQHVLEICSIFLPLDLPIQSNIFNFIRGLYISPEFLVDSIDKKLYIYSFFQKIGLISDLLNSRLNEYELDQCLVNCIISNSEGKSLRTQKFFYNIKDTSN